MNKNSAEARVLAEEIVASVGRQTEVDVVLCPAFTSMEAVARAIEGSTIALGAQNMSSHPSGAFTGEISSEMLRHLFCNYVILGHSERRTYFNETNLFINQKILLALESNLKPVLCIGETADQRRTNQTFDVLKNQLIESLDNVSSEKAHNVIIAYEPVWAIGTGEVASPELAQEAHFGVRGILKDLFGASASNKIRILYGGSMKPSNAADLMRQPDIDGGLIGGASLESKSFAQLVELGLNLVSA